MTEPKFSMIDLDFKSNKNAIIAALRSQEKFKDYDFEGSNLSVLIERLAENAWKHAWLANMLYSEAFLDSAQMRSSVVSRAKELNYSPSSARSSTARVRVSFVASGESSPYVIQKGKTFGSIVKNSQYTFSIPETITVSSADENFSFETDITEGTYLRDAHVFFSTESEPIPRFALSNSDADLSSLVVAVYENGATTPTPFQKRKTLLGVKPTDEIYFVQENSDGNYEITFGDGTFGRTPAPGSTVVLDYRICAGSLPDGASSFSINFDPTGSVSELLTSSGENPSVTTLSQASGGSFRESIETVRWRAPRSFQAQERAVTETDYAELLVENFPEIKTVSSYGGELENPPAYGKTIVCVALKDGKDLADSRIAEYKKFLAPRKVIGITPVFVNPERTGVRIDTTVRYNLNATSASAERIASLVRATVLKYNADHLDDFGVTLRLSALSRAIDETDDSIVSSVTRARAYKKTYPTSGRKNDLTGTFGIALAQASPSVKKIDSNRTLTSSPFVSNGTRVSLIDDGNGNINVVKTETDGTFSVIAPTGVVDYSTGSVVIRGLQVDSYDGTCLEIFVVPADPDIVAFKRNILSIEDSRVYVTVETVRE